MKTHVEFRSDQFPPYEGEDDEVNPGLYGKRLAEFLVRELKPKGFEPLKPVAEDWGWVIPIKNDGFRLSIGCGYYEEHPDGFLCFIEPHKPAIRKFPLLAQDRYVKAGRQIATSDRRNPGRRSQRSREAMVDVRGVLRSIAPAGWLDQA